MTSIEDTINAIWNTSAEARPAYPLLFSVYFNYTQEAGFILYAEGLHILVYFLQDAGISIIKCAYLTYSTQFLCL